MYNHLVYLIKDGGQSAPVILGSVEMFARNPECALQRFTAQVPEVLQRGPQGPHTVKHFYMGRLTAYLEFDDGVHAVARRTDVMD